MPSNANRAYMAIIIQTQTRRKRFIMAEIIVVKEKLKPLTARGVRYYFCLDGERIGTKFFLANADRQDFTTEASEGKHTLTMVEIGVAEGSVPQNILDYELNLNQPKMTVYLKYNNDKKCAYFTESAAEEKKSGGLFGKLFK